jgi:hypothetical protein
MKRVILASMATVFAAIALGSAAAAQTASPSLGDYARSVRQNKAQDTKAPSKVYDNDSLSSATISVVGGSSKSSAQPGNDNAGAVQADNSSSAPGTNNKKPADQKEKVSPGQSLQDRQKVFDAWKSRIDDQKKKVDQLAHDLDNYQHNATLAQVSVWPQTQQYGEKLAEKQKALEQAKTQLGDLQEQARKAGVPASVSD